MSIRHKKIKLYAYKVIKTYTRKLYKVNYVFNNGEIFVKKKNRRKIDEKFEEGN